MRPRPGLLGLLLVCAYCGGETASAAPGQPAPAAAPAAEVRLPPRRFAGVDTFLDAIRIEDETAGVIDSWWKPATEALVAANPGKAAIARSLAEKRRAAELAMYRPVVATGLDSIIVELLHPQVRAQLDALHRASSAEFAKTHRLSEASERRYAAEEARIRLGPQRRVEGELGPLAALARSEDGAALRVLLRNGYFWCVNVGADLPQDAARCTALAKTPALVRLKKTVAGENLIRVNAAAYAYLMGMISMAHDPGISLHQLLPPQLLAAAGLTAPADLSFEQLVGLSKAGTGKSHD